ncbi:MAG: DEAD/DEAH box helicase family protein [Nitrospira sp.]|nr:DEAD/DEAH box helicase family protein [Nitrospira sp.]
MVAWAHSPKKEEAIPAQSYAEHVENVRLDAVEKAAAAGFYSSRYGSVLTAVAGLAGEYHDLGKLDPANQAILSCGGGQLPINHVDAGAAYLLQDKSPLNVFAALLVYAHHRGLPSMPAEVAKERDLFRDEKIRQLTDSRIEEYVRAHHRLIVGSDVFKGDCAGITPMAARFGLSCLVDADHSDTARHYGNHADISVSPIWKTADERLALLDRYVKQLARGKSDSRTKLRNAVYEACRVASTTLSLYACDSPVGTGKTTAIMAHLLQAAIAKRLRRIIVVLPFTNIIDQSVAVYRQSLVLPGESEKAVVAAHHHRVEFQDFRSRQYSFLWQAPIIVTTAVQFFETLASNYPASLRKLHQIAGSAIFIDESHAALPAHLWPQAWKWIKELSTEWGCHCVLGSGSLTRFWELQDFVQPPESLSDLISEPIRAKARSAEKRRICYRTRPDELSLSTLVMWVTTHPGPRLLILNTVQSAAVIATAMKDQYGRDKVEHLSTALTPHDRADTLCRIRSRLDPKSADQDWTLVATSCVEAGVDLSFRTCFRERCSLVSLIQIGGRGNRSNEFPQIEVWDFQLKNSDALREHPAFKTSGRVLGELFQEDRVSSDHCKEAMRREIRQQGMSQTVQAIQRAEQSRDFPGVESEFKIIDRNTITALVSKELQDRLEQRVNVQVTELQQYSVQIWSTRRIEWGLRESLRYPGLMFWTLDYDNFVGYMKGVLDLNAFKRGDLNVI